jgi:hypothetical protein
MAAAILVLAGSCSTAAVVWDKGVPPEESAKVWFLAGAIKSYNGITITRKWQNIIVIPAGEAVIGLDVELFHENVLFRLRGMEFTCHLEGEKKYTIVGDTKDGQWGVSIYEGKIRSIAWATRTGGTFLEFIPFKNQPDSFKRAGLFG